MNQFVLLYNESHLSKHTFRQCLNYIYLPMFEKFYYVYKIDGEYAVLREINKGEDSEVFIALYLLPLGVTVNTKLHFENFEYSIIE